MRRSRKTPTLGEVLAAVVRQVVDEVEATLPAALADEPDGVHQHRVRVRRLRSVLGGFRDALDRRGADRVRVAYAEWGRELGVVRDIEVRAAVAEETLAVAGVDDPAVVRRLVAGEREAYAVAHQRLVELARMPRAVERVRMLREFGDAAIVVEPERPAADVLGAVLSAQARRVENAQSRLDGGEERYHDLRKAARRMRYVAEAVAEAAPGLFVKQVAALAAAGDGLHDALGAHRDALLLAQQVRREGALAGRAGEASDAYDMIGARARDEAAKQLDVLPPAMRRLRAAASRLP